MEEDIVFSIVIPTYEGARKIVGLLESIVEQDDTFIKEVTVCIDGSTDTTREVVSSFKNKLPITLIVQNNQGRASARNKGVETSYAPYFFFLDDDMRLTFSSVEKHANHHQSYPNSILVGKVAVDSSLLKTDFDYYVASLYESWEKAYPSKTQLSPHNLKFTTQHLSLPKSVFDKLGGFDARLTDAEDYDLGMRALEEGIPIYYDPTILAFHDDLPSCAKYIRRQIEYKKSHKRLHELGKSYLHSLFVPPQTPKGSLKRAILVLLSQSYWIMAVDRERLVFLPKKWRHKLYASIIYAHTLKGLQLI